MLLRRTLPGSGSEVNDMRERDNRLFLKRIDHEQRLLYLRQQLMATVEFDAAHLSSFRAGTGESQTQALTYHDSEFREVLRVEMDVPLERSHDREQRDDAARPSITEYLGSSESPTYMLYDPAKPGVRLVLPHGSQPRLEIADDTSRQLGIRWVTWTDGQEGPVVCEQAVKHFLGLRKRSHLKM